MDKFQNPQNSRVAIRTELSYHSAFMASDRSAPKIQAFAWLSKIKNKHYNPQVWIFSIKSDKTEETN